MNAEYAIEMYEARLACQTFVGDTLPIYCPNIGPDQCATLFGADLEFGERSTWARPILTDMRQVIGRPADFGNPYWRTLFDMTRLSLERGRGRWITGLTDFHTNADTLSALRGPSALCMDLAEDIEGVAEACAWVTRFFPAIFDGFWKLIAPTGQPCVSWIACPHRGPSYNVQSDFICMIGSGMFRRAVLPSLREEMAHLERSIYHLDGPGALVHLDDFLALPELNGIEWIFAPAKAHRGSGWRYTGASRRPASASNYAVRTLTTRAPWPSTSGRKGYGSESGAPIPRTRPAPL